MLLLNFHAIRRVHFFYYLYFSMIAFKKGNKLVCKAVLLAGYLFLFASQFNYRYFSIANFFVYGNSAVAGRHVHASSFAQQPSQAHTTRPVSLQDNRQRPSHLGIDKRFQVRDGIRVPQIRAPGLPSYTLVKPRFYSSLPVYSTSDLPTNALRGPPCA